MSDQAERIALMLVTLIEREGHTTEPTSDQQQIRSALLDEVKREAAYKHKRPAEHVAADYIGRAYHTYYDVFPERA